MCCEWQGLGRREQLRAPRSVSRWRVIRWVSAGEIPRIRIRSWHEHHADRFWLLAVGAI